jgi:hypothetical protein
MNNRGKMGKDEANNGKEWSINFPLLDGAAFDEHEGVKIM